MTRIINGKIIAEEIMQDLKLHIAYCKILPVLAIILASPSPASLIYVNNKIKAAEKIGIKVELYRMEENITKQEIEQKVQELNNRSEISAIIVQLPLYKHLDSFSILSTIDPEKDVDGLHPINVGMLYSGNKPYFAPCTPLGIVKMLETQFEDLAGLNVAIIGRSNIVGKPLASLLIEKDATVTLCHSKTKNIKYITQKSDIVVCASGQSLMFGRKYFNPNSVIIDVGINRTSDGKVVGDVLFDEVFGYVTAITKVPGGVGPMTIAYMLSNVCRAAGITIPPLPPE
ncbi:MAG: bifunctional 5,10-methylenetetrahydrofolate dehydrogenase/5,10-methenyltetrahydrofolate cyclohydrolase [Rickettsiaceae bacterium]|nr:bifunctional 5,10-methylenetetrahydrofolate dehydrogenase/5,10-methenyltetrahydrofolate cyclohydrolase [Rickettsiaceae bacterium]